MLYANNYDSKVSLGIGEQVFSSKLTKGQRKLEQQFWFALRNTEPLIKDFAEVSAHDEKFNTLV